MSSRQIEIVLEDDGMDGSYWAARHAVAVAIKHHETALKGIDRNKGRTRATANARLTHEDALANLKALQHIIVNARSEAIQEEGRP